MESEIREMLGEQLKDAYSAERQALRLMQKSLRWVSTEELRECIQSHIEESETQIERVQAAMEQLDVRPGRKVCEAMRGLVDEATHEAEEYDEGAILDLVIVAGMQRIEHYEIAAYGTNIALAQAVNERKIAELLQQTLDEEKATDQKLTEVTMQSIMPAALSESQDDNQSTGGSSRRSPGSRRSSSRASTASKKD